jgi:hypothetical protein
MLSRARVGLAGLVAAAALSGCTAIGHDASGPAPSPSAPMRLRVDRPAPVQPAVEQVRPVIPKRTPCSGNSLPKWVFVSIRHQHMWMCARHKVARDTAITTGMIGPYTQTPTGHYRIQGLNRNSTLTLNTGATYGVKFWIPFNAPLFGFHDASWQHFRYGSERYRTHGSHGCVHMPLAAIRYFYHWADIGTPVRITR